MEEKILDVLRVQIPDVKGEITLETSTDRYNGYILSREFKGRSFLDRQKRIFTILRKSLGADAQKIAMLFTYTPDEYEVLRSE